MEFPGVFQHPEFMRAGPWTFEFEPWSGWIRNVRWTPGDQSYSTLNAAYAGVRDSSWGTLKPSISVDSHESDGRVAHARWKAEYEPYRFSGRIDADDDSVRYQVDGTAKRDFETNRTGLCVLHPIGFGNGHGQIEHSTGLKEPIQWPAFISPNQPFFDVKSLSQVSGHVELIAEFAGEKFETEDQRNWTDASFKTYCGTVNQKLPLKLAAGSTLSHSVTLRAIVDVKKESPVGSAKVVFSKDGSAGTPKAAKKWGDFVALNRNRPEKGADVCFGTSPQSHSSDVRSILETPQGLEFAIRTATEGIGANSVWVGPARFGNANSRASDAVGAVWLVGALRAVCNAGAKGMTVAWEGDSASPMGRLKAILNGKTAQVSMQTSPLWVLYAEQWVVIVNPTPYALTLRLEAADLVVELVGAEKIPNDLVKVGSLGIAVLKR